MNRTVLCCLLALALAGCKNDAESVARARCSARIAFADTRRDSLDVYLSTGYYGGLRRDVLCADVLSTPRADGG